MSESLPLDRYVVDTLMADLVGHDNRPSAYLVYLQLWSWTEGGRKEQVPVSLREIADRTGLSKRGVQEALRVLLRRRLVSAKRASVTAVPTYTLYRPWTRRARG